MDGNSAGDAEDNGFFCLFHCVVFLLMMGQNLHVSQVGSPRKIIPIIIKS